VAAKQVERAEARLADVSREAESRSDHHARMVGAFRAELASVNGALAEMRDARHAAEDKRAQLELKVPCGAARYEGVRLVLY
jgi:predicted  nucleic acid-binding Zn-ribbon protein